MKLNTMLCALAAALFCAAGAFAQDQAAAPAGAPGQSQSTAPSDMQTKDQNKSDKKTAWENGVKSDCAAEIADGGVCAGKDFGTGLEKCLHKNRSKLSDGCKAAVRPHHGGKAKKGKKGAKMEGGSTEGGAMPGGDQPAPASTPAQHP